MRTFKMLIMVFAVVAAMGGAFASTMFAQTGWYDTNGPVSGGGVVGTITDPGDTPLCGAMGTNICKIQIGATSHNAFATQAQAEANAGASNPSAPGLLKYN